jgi:hypothetical protein
MDFSSLCKHYDRSICIRLDCEDCAYGTDIVNIVKGNEDDCK